MRLCRIVHNTKINAKSNAPFPISSARPKSHKIGLRFPSGARPSADVVVVVVAVVVVAVVSDFVSDVVSDVVVDVEIGAAV